MKSQLFNIRCDNCGSEYRINSRGEMNCPFCGSKIYLNDKDFEEFQKTRDEMLFKDKAENDLVNDTGDVLHKWNNELQVFLDAENGKTVNLRYFFKYDRPGKTVYVGRNKLSIVYDNANVCSKAVERFQSLEFPIADIHNLSKGFPWILALVNLKEDKRLLVLNKPENIYPLALFNRLDPKNVAWMISRMENTGCILQFNSLDFSDLTVFDLYINPKTHHMFFLDGWENAVDSDTPRHYLRILRAIAKDQMILERAPKKCIEFLEGEPAVDAYTDFKLWDDVINFGFNGHNFHPFTED